MRTFHFLLFTFFFMLTAYVPVSACGGGPTTCAVTARVTGPTVACGATVAYDALGSNATSLTVSVTNGFIVVGSPPNQQYLPSLSFTSGGEGPSNLFTSVNVLWDNVEIGRIITVTARDATQGITCIDTKSLAVGFPSQVAITNGQVARFVITLPQLTITPVLVERQVVRDSGQEFPQERH